MNFALAGDDDGYKKHRNDGPDGNTYEVYIKSSYGDEKGKQDSEWVKDCFTFDKYSPGKLETHVFGYLVYAHDKLNTDDEDWQATSFGNSYYFGVHGSTDDHGKEIKGDAIDGYGTTYVFKGHRVKYCKAEDGQQPPVLE
jgi:hypothetical protein